MQVKVKKFQKRKEDFVCENCGEKVKGSGYTNHCPKCLWSKHVDIFPGDRLEDCGGMMEPIDVETGKGGKLIIIHKCVKCGELSKVGASEEDDTEALVDISSQNVDDKMDELLR